MKKHLIAPLSLGQNLQKYLKEKAGEIQEKKEATVQYIDGKKNITILFTATHKGVKIHKEIEVFAGDKPEIIVHFVLQADFEDFCKKELKKVEEKSKKAVA